MKLLNLSLLTLALVSQFSFAAAPKLGGNSGGGGDLTRERTIFKEELELYLRDVVPTLVEWHFNAYSYQVVNQQFLSPDLFGGVEGVKAIEEKLTARPNDIFAAIRTAKVLIQDTPCLDPETGAPKEASANRETMTVCFDVNAIWLATSSTLVFKSALALAVHEYSHLVGTTESEAKGLELLAFLTIKVPSDLLPRLVLDWKETARHPDGENVLDLQRLIAHMDSLSDAGLAFALISVTNEIEREMTDLVKKQAQMMIGPFGNEMQAEIFALTIRISAMKSYLNSVPSALEFLGLYESFAVQPWDGPITIKEYLRRAQVQDLSDLRLPGELFDVSRGDRVAVKRELLAIQATYKKMFSN